MPLNRNAPGAVHTSVTGLRDDADVRAAFAAHGAELYRFALRALGDTGAAEDVVQETFLRAWRAAERYDASVASLRVWLFAIARNTVTDHVRAARVRPWDAVPLTPPPDAVATVDVSERLLDAWVIEEALGRISEPQRAAIVETHLRERPYDEVAKEQRIAVGTLRSRVFYGLRSLRSALDEMGVTP